MFMINIMVGLPTKRRVPSTNLFMTIMPMIALMMRLVILAILTSSGMSSARDSVKPISRAMAEAVAISITRDWSDSDIKHLPCLRELISSPVRYHLTDSLCVKGDEPGSSTMEIAA